MAHFFFKKKKSNNLDLMLSWIETLAFWTFHRRRLICFSPKYFIQPLSNN